MLSTHQQPRLRIVSGQSDFEKALGSHRLLKHASQFATDSRRPGQLVSKKQRAHEHVACRAEACSGVQRVTEVARHLASPGTGPISRARDPPGDFSVRQAVHEELWDIASVHCESFYPNAGFLCGPLLRLDRFLALQVGPRCEISEWSAFYASLVACSSKDCQEDSLPRPSVPTAALQEWPTQDASSTAAVPCSVVLGAITVDSLGGHLPECLAIDTKDAGEHRHVAEMTCKGIAYISNLAVASDMRRHGIGYALLQAAEKQAQEWGCLASALHCNPANAAAFQLYRRAGYRTVTVEPGWYSFLQGQSRLEVMTKSLVANA